MRPNDKRYFNFNHRRELAVPHVNVPGILKGNHIIINADYDVQVNDTIIVCDSPTDIYVYLRCALGYWSMLIIKNVNVGNVYVIPCASPSDTIDDETYQLLMQWDSMQIVDYLTSKWIIV